MIVQTKAIVLRIIKFQDTSLIVKCYTEQGLKSYLLKAHCVPFWMEIFSVRVKVISIQTKMFKFSYLLKF